MTLVELPPASPALAVHQAALTLRRIAERSQAAMARNDYWRNGWESGVSNAIGGYAGDLAAVFTPELAIEFADWLDAVASAAARNGEPIPPLALTFTRTPAA